MPATPSKPEPLHGVRTDPTPLHPELTNNTQNHRCCAASVLSKAMPNKLPWRLLLILWVAAALLSCIGLGNVPLRDFDEATVARVALELHQGAGEAALLPTLWNEPYLNKAPGLHLIIAAVIGVMTREGLPSEWVIRLAPALMSSLIVPLGGLLQWELRPRDRDSCLATSAILLTLLPISRHGRLAMLDGTQLTVMALLWLGLMQLRHTRHPTGIGLVTGLAASGMLLLKAPLLLPTAAAGLTAAALGQEWRHWRAMRAAPSLLIGITPGVAWHLWHAHHRGSSALWLWGGDGAGRVLLDAGEGSDLGWRVPIIELLEGGWPWLVLLPIAIVGAWRLRHSRWGYWCLGTLTVLCAAILPLRTQLPWYSHPLWLPFALLCSPLLAWIVNRQTWHNRAVPMRRILTRTPALWAGIGLTVLLLGLASLVPAAAALTPYRSPAIALGLGWCAGGSLLMSETVQKRRLGAISVVLGNITALALIFTTPLWLWELNESWAVRPVADLTANTAKTPLRLKGYDERPSLNWYSQQRILRTQTEDDNHLYLSDQPQTNCKTLASKGAWALSDCDNITVNDK